MKNMIETVDSAMSIDAAQFVVHLEKGTYINKCKNTCIYIFSIYLCYYMCEDMW